MHMPTYDLPRLRERVRGLRGRYSELSRAAGVSGSWLSKFGRGDYESPRLATVVRLADALNALESTGQREASEDTKDQDAA